MGSGVIMSEELFSKVLKGEFILHSDLDLLLEYGYLEKHSVTFLGQIDNIDYYTVEKKMTIDGISHEANRLIAVNRITKELYSE